LLLFNLNDHSALRSRCVVAFVLFSIENFSSSDFSF
jgi:hypothetical protein